MGFVDAKMDKEDTRNYGNADMRCIVVLVVIVVHTC